MKFKTLVRQAGGKYGKHTCPFCGRMAGYKFSVNFGWCDNCDATWQSLGGWQVEEGEKQRSPHYLTMEIVDLPYRYEK